MDSTSYNLDLAFQPVVDSASGEIDHHEIIGRFPRLDGPGSASTRFEGEAESDLGAALDLALGQGVVTLLQGRPYDRMLLPISWRSCALDLFRTEFERLLRVEPSVRRRMILEFVAADDVFGIAEAANYLAELRRLGCRLCLSEFGTGNASYRFLRLIDVDYIKIDEVFLTAAQSDPRERLLLREATTVCADLDYKSIATGIDDARIADLAARAGITLGQGTFYGPAQETLVSHGFPVHLAGGASSPARTPFFLN
jgi:EAL domain-containing protein (putative c-di-GMP-specific phosphodiesterase class I)